MQDHRYVLILAGGGGTRLWPKSREQHPKQFLKLGREVSLLRATVERATQLTDWDHIYIITNKSQLKDVIKDVPEIAKDHIICEPQKRETAMAMGVGAAVIHARDPEAVIMNFASDHVVENERAFLKVMKKAASLAEEGTHLVTVGISPTYPHTGMGYIKIGKEIEAGDLPVFAVSNFTEKPSISTAQAFISTGKYFWNANMYTWRSSALLAAMQLHAPHTAQAILELLPSIGHSTFHSQLEKTYDSVEKIAIDYAVSEKADNLLLVPGDFGWNDIGDWSVVYDLGKKNESGTVVLKEENGRLVEIEAVNNLVHLDGRLVALMGIQDMVVVDTEEILLVMPRSRSQDVKKIVEQIKTKNLDEYL